MSGALEIDVAVTRASGFTLEVALSAPPGITALFGDSGAGKSTTLAAIAGLVRPSRGKIALGGDVWFDGARGVDVVIEARKVAFVFQSLALFPHLSVIENVTYGMPRGLTRDERRARGEALLSKLEVGALADRATHTLSGGEAQRVALARALAIEPRAALFDEPFSALDPSLRRELGQQVRAFVAELGIPALFVTHDRDEAETLADHAVRLDRGRVA